MRVSRTHTHRHFRLIRCMQEDMQHNQKLIRMLFTYTTTMKLENMYRWMPTSPCSPSGARLLIHWGICACFVLRSCKCSGESGTIAGEVPSGIASQGKLASGSVSLEQDSSRFNRTAMVFRPLSFTPARSRGSEVAAV